MSIRYKKTYQNVKTSSFLKKINDFLLIVYKKHNMMYNIFVKVFIKNGLVKKFIGLNKVLVLIIKINNYATNKVPFIVGKKGYMHLLAGK